MFDDAAAAASRLTSEFHGIRSKKGSILTPTSWHKNTVNYGLPKFAGGAHSKGLKDQQI